jgi:spore germination cell wall hydrolase CwlJ-like protein
MTEAARLLRRLAIALAVWREARGESLLGKLLVAQVIENRMRDPRWPETPIAVITQRAQFSSFLAGDPNSLAWPSEDDPAWADAVAAADLVLAAPSPVTRANHYHAVGVTPAWARPEAVVAREGRHVFYQL